jgi:hypothetical protein
MNRFPHFAILILAVFGCIILVSSNLIESAESQEKEKTAEQVYRNIQVFKGVPASQLLGQ